MTETGSSHLLRQFADFLSATAEQMNLTVDFRPELADSKFSGSTSVSTTLSASDLPTEAFGLAIGRYTIVLGVLPDVPALEAVRESLRRYRNQCVVARSFLSPPQSLDLQLMLVGPPGSERQDAWRALALMVERDDRVARKLTWLRPEDRQHDKDSYQDFVKRTFLARPWRRALEFQNVALDQLAEPSGASAGLPRSTAEEWERIALEPNRTPEQIVAALVEAWERRVS
jgi:hypothetical protein